MSDPYAEATRHMRRGMPLFAKVALILGGLFAVGLTTLVVVGLLLAKRVSETAWEFQEHPAETVSAMVEKYGDDVTVVATDGDADQVTLRVGDSGEIVTVDLAETADWVRGAIKEGVHFDGEANESGGALRIETSEGDAIIEIRGDEAGGFLRISGSGDEMRFGAGDASAALPEWVPIYPEARLHKRVFSAKNGDRSFGMAVLRTDASPQEVIDWYRDALEGEGFSLSVEFVRDDAIRGRIEAESRRGDDREVSVMVVEDNDGDRLITILHRTKG